MATHKKYGGSTIERVELCPGSVKACEEIGPVPPGAAAERGTRIHALVEQLWNEELSSDWDSVGWNKTELDVAASVISALKVVASEYGFTSDQVQMELPVTLREISPDAGGIIDHVAVKAFGDLFIADTKTGYVYVGAEENIQMLFYACCMMQCLDPFTRASINIVHLVILQPEQEPPYEVAVRKWSIPVAELKKYEARFIAAIDRAETQPDLRIAGDHCESKWCNARTTCPVYKDYLNDRSMGSFAKLLDGAKPTDPEVRPGRGGRLAEQARAIKNIRDWCKAVEDDMKSELMKDSTSVPGWSLVDSWGHRTWTDEKKVQEAAKELGLKSDEYNSRKLVTPAQFEKLLKIKKLTLDLDPLTEKPYIGNKLAESKEAANLDKEFKSIQPLPASKENWSTRLDAIQLESVNLIKEIESVRATIKIPREEIEFVTPEGILN